MQKSVSALTVCQILFVCACALMPASAASAKTWPARFVSMPNFQTIPFADGVAHVLSRAELATQESRTSAFEGKTKDHRFYEIVADTLDNFEHHYLSLEDSTGRVRGIQPVFFVQQNLIEGIPALLDGCGPARCSAQRITCGSVRRDRRGVRVRSR